MNAVAHGIDRQLDDRARLAHDESTVDSHIENAPRGAQVIQIHHVSTPTLVAMLLATAISCGALGYAINARDSAQLAEREARLAQKDQANNQIQIEALKLVLSQEKRP